MPMRQAGRLYPLVLYSCDSAHCRPVNRPQALLERMASWICAEVGDAMFQRIGWKHSGQEGLATRIGMLEKWL